MSNLPNENRVDVWFDQLERSVRHLPGEEREKLHHELRQHLESLVADHMSAGKSAEEAQAVALSQMGNPGRIGRKVYLVWKQARGGFRAETGAIFFGLGLHVLKSLIVGIVSVGVYSITKPHVYLTDKLDLSHWMTTPLFGQAGSILIAFAIGSKYPLQAIRGALYSKLLCDMIDFVWISVMLSKAQGHYSPSMSTILGIILLETPLWLGGHVAIAYLASVTKRGWYKPTLADFKLTLPKRWARVSR